MDPLGGARFPPKSLQKDCSTILLESVQDLHHIPHLALYAEVLFFLSYTFLNKPMLWNIRKCITAEAHRATGNNSWTVTLNELNKFVGLIVARGVIGGRTLPINIMWDKSWACSLFNATMPRWRFLDIMKYLRFDLKIKRRKNLEEDKFCLAFLLWNPFLENCLKAYNLNVNTTIDEQLFPCRASDVVWNRTILTKGL